MLFRSLNDFPSHKIQEEWWAGCSRCQAVKLQKWQKSFVWGMEKKLCVRKRQKSGHFCTLNLPSDFPQMQFSFCTIMNMCISKFAKLHVVARHMFCKLMSNLVWYFSILYVSVNEIWALQQRGRLLTNEFQSFHVMASEELKHFLTSCHFHCLKKNSEH